MDAVGTSLFNKMNLKPELLPLVKSMLKDLVKVMMPALNTDLLELQGELDINPTPLAVKNALGAQFGQYHF